MTGQPRAPRKKAASRALAPEDLESPLQQRMEQYLRYTGWLVFHDSATNHAHLNAPGFPDICAVHEGTGVVVFLEFKSRDGQLSPEQERWRAALLAHPGPTTHHYAVVRPAQEAQIQGVLDDLRQPKPCGNAAGDAD